MPREGKTEVGSNELALRYTFIGFMDPLHTPRTELPTPHPAAIQPRLHPSHLALSFSCEPERGERVHSRL